MVTAKRAKHVNIAGAIVTVAEGTDNILRVGLYNKDAKNSQAFQDALTVLASQIDRQISTADLDVNRKRIKLTLKPADAGRLIFEVEKPLTFGSLVEICEEASSTYTSHHALYKAAEKIRNPQGSRVSKEAERRIGSQLSAVVEVLEKNGINVSDELQAELRKALFKVEERGTYRGR